MARGGIRENADAVDWGIGILANSATNAMHHN
jgi:hypothetical protein